MQTLQTLQSLQLRLKKYSDKHKHFLHKHKRFLIAALGLIAVLLIAQGLYQWLYGGQSATPSVVVQTVRVKEAEVTSIIETVGSLISPKEVTIKAIVPAKVQKILLESGSFAKAGTELATLVAGPEVRAPFDGYLDDWLVKVGDYVQAGEKLVHFVNTDVLSINYRVPEHFGPALDLGQQVIITVRAFPETEFRGEVRFVSPIVDKKTGSILVRAEIDNLDQNLWAGMSAHVRHVLEVKSNALVVPESALCLDLEGYSLLILEEGILKRRSIKVGERKNGRAHIISGVKAGEMLLMTQSNQAREGVEATAEEWTGDW